MDQHGSLTGYPGTILSELERRLPWFKASGVFTPKWAEYDWRGGVWCGVYSHDRPENDRK